MNHSNLECYQVIEADFGGRGGKGKIQKHKNTAIAGAMLNTTLKGIHLA
jgi:hypothetical protein